MRQPLNPSPSMEWLAVAFFALLGASAWLLNRVIGPPHPRNDWDLRDW